MATFVTTDREVARRFRAAYLTGRTINGDVCGHRFAKARVCSVKRDPLSVKGRWKIRIEEVSPNWWQQENGVPWEGSIFPG